MDGFREDYGGGTYREDRFALDFRHAPGYIQVMVPEPGKPAEHPTFRGPDNGTGIDDDGLCVIGVLHNRAAVMPQDFHQFGSIAEIVPAAVCLDKDGTAAERIKKVL
jgi:hypothetical protein